MAIASLLLLLLLLLLLASSMAFVFMVSPTLVHKKLRRSGFTGPSPRFPLGNLLDMTKKEKIKRDPSEDPLEISHDIHSIVFPHFAQWRKLYGKVFIYWLGTEPFLYIADPEYLKVISSVVVTKNWGKPTVFRRDRQPMFGDGLVMVEGDRWVSNRHTITPLFSMTNLNAMISNMVEITTTMLGEWTASASATGTHETDVEPYIVRNAADIIAMASFGVDDSKGKAAFDKFKALQVALFSPNRLAGVPFGEYVQARRTAECRRLGEEIDGLLLSVIESRQRKSKGEGEGEERIDLLGLLMRSGKGLTARELVDECKTFFFAGHETTALAITWTMFLLALHPDWQRQLREEVAEATGGGGINAVAVTKLTKMTWVMNEVLRLYPSAPNLLRQAREDIWVGDKTVIPHGTNIWIDVVGMHHDRALWGVDVDEFRAERFKDSPYGGCTHRMGYVPFGYGGRVCVGKNLSVLEYKVVVSLILKRFSLSLSPNYEHSPAVMLTMRPSRGMPLILETL